MVRTPQQIYTGISVLISRPTSNVHLTASAYNAPSYFSVPGCFQRPARGQSYGFRELSLLKTSSRLKSLTLSRVAVNFPRPCLLYSFPR